MLNEVLFGGCSVERENATLQKVVC